MANVATSRTSTRALVLAESPRCSRLRQFSWFNALAELLVEHRGPGVDALIDRVEAAVASYPYPDKYRVWPGPNSNSFTAYVARQVPALGSTCRPRPSVRIAWRKARSLAPCQAAADGNSLYAVRGRPWSSLSISPSRAFSNSGNSRVGSRPRPRNRHRGGARDRPPLPAPPRGPTSLPGGRDDETSSAVHRPPFFADLLELVAGKNLNHLLQQNWWRVAAQGAHHIRWA